MNSDPWRRAGSREWIGLAVIALPCLLYSLDLTVLNLAVPSLSASLKPSASQLLWIVDIYGFLIAGSLISMGTLGDRIGRRRLLLTGAAAFGLASVLAAFSASAGMLIATRAILGVAGATLAPSTLSLIRNMFLDPRQRSQAIGIWAASFSAGAAIGPLLGGALLEHFWWGSVFLIAVPVMLLLLVLGPVLLPEFRDPHAGRLDLLSAGMSLVAVLAIIYGLKQIAQDGLRWLPGLSILAGLAVGFLFLNRQRSLADPLIDLRLFRSPIFSTAVAANTLAIFLIDGAFLYSAQYLQLVLGLSPLHAGLWSLPSASSLILGSLLAPVLVRRVRAAFVVAGGLVLAAFGLGVLTQIARGSGLALLVTGTVLVSFGIALLVPLSTDMIVGAVQPERAGAASGISETGTEFGGALGIAILGSIGTAVYRGIMAGALPAGIPAPAADAARNTLGGALSASRQLPNPLGGALLGAARGAFTQSFELTAGIAAAVALGAAFLAAVVLPRMQASPQPGRQPEREQSE